MPTRALLFALLAFAFLTPAAAARAAEISIVRPSSGATIHSNRGRLEVELRRAGAPPGARVRLLLDGIAGRRVYRGNAIELDGLDRGSHRLQAVLLDAHGHRIAASAPVRFYLWHASRRFPSRR